MLQPNIFHARSRMYVSGDPQTQSLEALRPQVPGSLNCLNQDPEPSTGGPPVMNPRALDPKGFTPNPKLPSFQHAPSKSKALSSVACVLRLQYRIDDEVTRRMARKTVGQTDKSASPQMHMKKHRLLVRVLAQLSRLVMPDTF